MTLSIGNLRHESLNISSLYTALNNNPPDILCLPQYWEDMEIDQKSVKISLERRGYTVQAGPPQHNASDRSAIAFKNTYSYSDSTNPMPKVTYFDLTRAGERIRFAFSNPKDIVQAGLIIPCIEQSGTPPSRFVIIANTDPANATMSNLFSGHGYVGCQIDNPQELSCWIWEKKQDDGSDPLFVKTAASLAAPGTSSGSPLPASPSTSSSSSLTPATSLAVGAPRPVVAHRNYGLFFQALWCIPMLNVMARIWASFKRIFCCGRC